MAMSANGNHRPPSTTPIRNHSPKRKLRPDEELRRSDARANEAKGELLYRALASVAENEYEKAMAKELAAEILRRVKGQAW